MKKHFKVLRQNNMASIGLFFIRAVVGIAFMHHGWMKIQHPFDWMGPDAGTPAIFQALAALSEFGGGLAWALGLLTPLASLGIFFTMLVALHLHVVVKGDPFVGHNGSYELPLVYLSVAILLLTTGPGKHSIDRKLFGEK